MSIEIRCAPLKSQVRFQTLGVLEPFVWQGHRYVKLTNSPTGYNVFQIQSQNCYVAAQDAMVTPLKGIYTIEE